jgi:hypothetical protein
VITTWTSGLFAYVGFRLLGNSLVAIVGVVATGLSATRDSVTRTSFSS